KHAALVVATEEDLARAYFALQDAGVPIYQAVDHTSQKSIYFYDPDDNLLEIVWERPNTREIFRQGRGDGDIPIEFKRPLQEEHFKEERRSQKYCGFHFLPPPPSSLPSDEVPIIRFRIAAARRASA